VKHISCIKIHFLVGGDAHIAPQFGRMWASAPTILNKIYTKNVSRNSLFFFIPLIYFIHTESAEKTEIYIILILIF